jgi:DNA-binding winged helix-turn-helix (wHTH) protein
MSVSRLPDWRQAGCSAACWRKPVLIIGEREKTLLECHDVASHEAYAHGLVTDDVLTVGPLRIDRRLMTVALAGAPLYVTPTEYSLLLTLAERAGSVVESQDILERVWRGWLTGSTADMHTLRANVSRLRERLGTSAWLISTKAGFGYWMPTTAPHGAPPPEPAPPERQYPPQINRRQRPVPLGRRQQTLLTLLRRTPEHRVSVALAAVHAYGRSTAKTRTAVRQVARKAQRDSLVVRECWGPLPEGGSIWIEEAAP